MVQALIQQHPQRLVYVSCSPDTLARDLKLLLAGGYVLDDSAGGYVLSYPSY